MTAAGPAPRRRGIGRRELLQIGALAAGAAGLTWLLRRGAGRGIDLSGNAAAMALLADRTSPAAGRADADLAVVIFSDYNCPACRATSPLLHEAARGDGRVRLIYRDWPILGEASRRAARVALAVHRQRRYPMFHEALMTHPGPVDETALRRVAAAVGASWLDIERDLAGRGPAIDLALARTGADAAALGLQGTPAYLIGGLLVPGALDQPGLRDAFARGRSLAGAGTGL